MINESNFSEDNLINFAFNALSFYNLSFNHTSYFGIKTTLFFLLIVVNAHARFTAVEVLAVPPFGLQIAITLPIQTP